MSKVVVVPHARISLEQLAISSKKLAEDFAQHDDWISRANAQSAAEISTLASQAASRAPSGSPTSMLFPTSQLVEDIKAPLLAAIGAADLALQRVNEIVAAMLERAGEVRSDAETRVEERRARIAKLQDELPAQVDDIRGKLTSEELRKFAEGYAEAAQKAYNTLIERGEAAVERLRNEQPASVNDVATQSRAAGVRAAKLVGVELPKKAQKAVTPVKKATTKAPRKKAPAKKAAARKAFRR